MSKSAKKRYPRLVRSPRGKTKDGALVGALDLGGSKAVCLLARVGEGAFGGADPDIVGVGVYGISRSDNLSPLARLEKAARASVDAAERMAGEEINRIYVAAPGRFLHCRRVGVDLDVSGGLITHDDIRDSFREGAKLASAEGYDPLHTLPVGYSVDGEEGISDPCGLTARLLTSEILGVSVRSSHLANLTAAVEQCGLKVSGCVAAPLAAATSILIDDEKELGVLLLDIGARSTDYAVYENGALVDCGGAPIGGAHITKDIAQIFGVPIAQAERAKTLHGSALAGPGDEHRCVELSQLGDHDEKIRISRAELSAVIVPRVEEIFEQVAIRLAQSGASRAGLRRVVLTGGASLLVGARETAERAFSMKARLGRPVALAGAPEATTGPDYAVCTGLIQHVAASQVVGGEARGARGVFADGADQIGANQFGANQFGGRLFGNVGSWMRARF